MDLLDVEGWRRVDDEGSTFRRPLGLTEYGFYWDTVFNGVASTATHLELQAEKGFEDKLFSKENLEAAWLRLKQRHPLLGASTEQVPDKERVEFVLREDRLLSILPGEFNFLSDLNTAKDVEHFTEVVLNGPPLLDDTFLARVWAGPQLDIPGRFHIFIPVVHHITDGMGNATVVRELCQELASLSPSRRVQTLPLSTRLQTLLPVEALQPPTRLSLPRRRWRIVIAKVIAGLRQAKMTGGHTLPARAAPSLGVSVKSRIQDMRLSPQQTKAVVTGCRALGITLGNALPVLSQLGVSRVLHRRRRRGEIPDDEWEHRRQQPMHFAGPVNYRPYLDRAWHAAGGAHEVMLAIAFSALTLPFLPTAPATADADATGAPPLRTLLSPARFLARVRMAQVHGQALLGHPLLHEFHLVRLPERNQRARLSAAAWQAAQRGEGAGTTAHRPGEFSTIAPCVFTNGGASLGNRDHLLPREYPLPRGDMAPALSPRLRLLSAAHSLRCRPGELYLGASTSQGQMSIFTCIDANTWDPQLVLEWMEEVKDAALFYLGNAAPKERDLQLARL